MFESPPLEEIPLAVRDPFVATLDGILALIAFASMLLLPAALMLVSKAH